MLGPSVKGTIALFDHHAGGCMYENGRLAAKSNDAKTNENTSFHSAL